MSTIRLTMSQALTKWMINQSIEQFDGTKAPAFAGVWGIFGHGNVAGLGEALYSVKDQINTYRGHNEQGMAHAAIAFAKQNNRRQMMAVTSSIGPGATNFITACALAYVNRLPILFLPGDVFANRLPDPVLQQAENFADSTVSANDCFRPISRYFDRISRPEQLIQSLPKSMSILTDPADCGPVTLSLCQDVQAEAYDYPSSLFIPKIWKIRRQVCDQNELETVIKKIKSSKKPLLIAGGGVKYSGAENELKQLVELTGVPFAVTQAGKSCVDETNSQFVGSIGVTGSSSANQLAKDSDLVISVGSRLQDFTTGSNTLITSCMISINIQNHDVIKHNSITLLGDAKVSLHLIVNKIGHFCISEKYKNNIQKLKSLWDEEVNKVTVKSDKNSLPSDSQVIGAVNRNVPRETIVIGAAGSMPGELHKLWNSHKIHGYHMEYGFSCMGYEIPAGIGVYLAEPNRPNIIFAGDGSYMMMNSELATAAMMGVSTTVVVTDNRGFGCINRLQKSTGNEPFNNLFKDSFHRDLPNIDYVSHARSMGANSEKANSLEELEILVKKCINSKEVNVIVIDTDPDQSTEAGGTWWDVAIPSVSPNKNINEAFNNYVSKKKNYHGK